MKRFVSARRLLCLALAALTLVAFAACALAEGEVFKTWEEYEAANGITSMNYETAADAIDTVIDHAVALYDAGESKDAYEYAKATYWGYYETTGFERNVMTYLRKARS